MQDDDAGARAKRESVFRNAVITIVESERQVECRVRNVSDTGAGVSHKGELTDGMKLRVAIGKLPEKVATVAWANATQAGIAFDDSSREAEIKFGDGLNIGAGWLVDLSNPYQR